MEKEIAKQLISVVKSVSKECTDIDISIAADILLQNELDQLSEIAWKNSEKEQNLACGSCALDGNCDECISSDITTIFQLELDKIQVERADADSIVSVVVHLMEFAMKKYRKVMIKLLSEESKHLFPLLCSKIENSFSENDEAKILLNISKVNNIYITTLENLSFKTSKSKDLDYFYLSGDLILFVNESELNEEEQTELTKNICGET